MAAIPKQRRRKTKRGSRAGGLVRLRKRENSGKSKGGGVCFMVNNNWCSDMGVISSDCSPHLEHLMIGCRPFFLPREFTSVVLT